MNRFEGEITKIRKTKRGQAQKINIHFPLRGKCYNYCVGLNRDIRRLTESTISFSPNSFQIPHLTMHMSFVSEGDDYDAVVNEIYAFSQQMKPISINLTRPYLKSPHDNYVFIGTMQSDEIIKIKSKIAEKIGKWIEPLSWDVVNEEPHITVAYIENEHIAVRALLENYSIGPNWRAEAFEISYVGIVGTCIGSIRSFEFP